MRILKSQKGNIFAMLFAAVAMTGVLGVVGMQTVSGPITTITKVTQKNITDTDIMTNGRIMVLNAATRPENDSGHVNHDGDAELEPAPYVACANVTAPTGGGCLPTDVGVVRTNPWGTEYGYCVWNHGLVNTGVTNMLQGRDDGTGAVLAIISAGPNKTFETDCYDYDGSAPEGISPEVKDGMRVTGTDDSAKYFTYAEAAAGAGGLWSLKSGTTDTAVVEDNGVTNFEIGTGSNMISFDTATGEGEFPYIKVDVLAGHTGSNVELAGGLRLDDESAVTTCNAGAAGVMRYNAADGIVEICDGSSWSGANATEILDEDSDTWVRVANDDGSDSDVIRFAAGANAEHMRILANGNVGIGTTTPVGPLHIATVVDAGANSSGDAASLVIGDYAGAHIQIDNNEIIAMSNATTETYLNLRDTINVSGNAWIAGNVGIGTTSPGVNLHVANSAADSNVWMATENDAQQWLVGVRGDNSDTFQIVDNTGGTDTRLAITPAGNVGIGTTSPISTLDVAGDAHFQRTGGGSQLYIQTPASDVRILARDSTGANQTLSLNPGSGDVGVGILAPSSKLHVAGAIQIANDSGTCDGTKAGAIRYNSSVMEFCEGAAWTEIGGVIELLREIENVNISSDPAADSILVWNDTTKKWDAVATSGVTTGGSTEALKLEDDDNDTKIQVEESSDEDHIRFDTAGTERMVIDETGNVGIGDATPNHKLDVEGDVNAAALELDSVTGAAAPTGGGAALLWTESSGDIYRSTGNVGIGTPTPGQKLDVNGNVVATAYFHSSDERLKDNIQTSDGLDLISKMRGVTFDWKSDGSASAGIIAQEIEKVMPSAVKTGNDGIKSVEYDQFIAPLIEAVKELKAENEALRARIETLEEGK